MASFNCSVCSENFSNSQRIPKVLNCGHTFCLKCLSNPLVYRCFFCKSLLTKEAKEYPTNLLLLKQLKIDTESSSDLLRTLKDFRGQLLVNEQIIEQNIADQKRLTTKISYMLVEAEALLYMMESGHVYNLDHFNSSVSTIKNVLRNAAESSTVPFLPSSILKDTINSTHLPSFLSPLNRVVSTSVPSFTSEDCCSISLPSPISDFEIFSFPLFSRTTEEICCDPVSPVPYEDDVFSFPEPSITSKDQIFSVPVSPVACKDPFAVPFKPSTTSGNKTHSVPLPLSAEHKIQSNSTMPTWSCLPPKKRYCRMNESQSQIISTR